MQASQIQAVPNLAAEPSPYKEFRRPIIDILADLSKPIPKKYLATRVQGGATLTYLPWVNCCKLLDRCAPGWQGEVTHMHTTSDRLFLTYRLSLHAEEGIFTREATGTELLKEEYLDKKTQTVKIRELAYGDPSSNSESMALRRAAAKFGLGLYLYQKE